ncbi:hypothetical protein LguiB_008765 [Lonicera macranthoides]
MAHTAKFLQPIRFRASFTSITSQSTTLLYGKFQPLKTWMKDIQPLQLHFRIPGFHWKLYAHQFLPRSNSCNSGPEYSWGSIFGMSIVLGSASLYPRVAYSMNGSDVLDDVRQVGSLDASDQEEDQIAFLIFARKLLAPVFLVLTVWMNWGHPIILASKVLLILFTTKPSPFSVYIFVDQSLYAKKVEVEDYTFLCVARVEIEDKRLTLIGILGNWWVLQFIPCEGALTALKNRTLNYIRNSVSEY